MANKVHEIAFKIAGSLAGNFSSTFKAANTAVQQFGKGLNSMNLQAAQVGKIVKLREELRESATAAKNAMWKVRGLTEKLNALKNQSGASQEEIDKLERELNSAKVAADKARDSFHKKQNALNEVERAAGTTGQTLEKLKERQDRLTQSAEKARIAQEKLAKATELQNKLKTGAKSSAMSLAGMAAGAVGTAAIPVKEAMAMEDAMAEVRKVTDFTPEGLNQMQQTLEKMSMTIPFTATELAQITAAAAQSGIAQKDLAGFTEQAAKMGVAFDISAEEAGTMMAKWKSGMGLSLDQTYKLADATNALSNDNAAMASQIGEVLKRYGALGKVSGFTETEIAALGATVIASGAEAEVAATGIQAFVRNLAKGESLSKKAANMFDKVGLDPAQLQKNLQKDAAGTIISTLEQIQKTVPKDKWNEYLSVMFGDESSKAIAPMIQNLDLLKKNFKMVGDQSNYSGSMLNEFKSRASTTSNSLQLMKNAASYVARAIGQPLLEPLKEVATKVVEVAQKIGNWISKNQELVTKILKIGGIIFGIVAAFHVFRIAIWAVVSPLLSVYKVIKTVTIAINLYRAGANLATAATMGQKVALIAVRGAMLLWKGAVLLAKGVWIAFKAVCTAGWWLIQKAAVLGAKAAVLLWKGAVLLAKGVWIAFKAVCTAAVWVAQTAAMIASKVALLAWKAVVLIATAVQWAWNAALSANPIALVVIAIAALIAAGVALYKNWDKVKEMCKSLWKSIKSFFGKIGDFVSGIWEKIGGVWDKITGFFGGGKKTAKISASVSAAGGGPKIPQMASGGIATGPTLAMIGEGKESEAVLPLSKLKSMIGGDADGGSMTVNFAPVINISGGGNVEEDVRKGIDAGLRELEKSLEKIQRNKRRLSYV